MVIRIYMRMNTWRRFSWHCNNVTVDGGHYGHYIDQISFRSDTAKDVEDVCEDFRKNNMNEEDDEMMMMMIIMMVWWWSW